MPSARESGILTLAAIRRGKGETYYLFNEKQRILTLAAGGKAGRDTTALLREVHRKKLPVRAQIDTYEGVIYRAGSLSEKELEEFRRNRIFAEKPEKPKRLNVRRLIPRFSISSSIIAEYVASGSANELFPITRRRKRSSISAQNRRAAWEDLFRCRRAFRFNT